VGRRAGLLLRVNLDIDAGGHAYISTSRKQNKFGVPHGQAPAILRWAAGLPAVDVVGVHSHIGSQITETGTFLAAARSLVEIVRALREAGVPVRELDFGGGYGVRYHGFLAHPALPEEHPERSVPTAAEMLEAILPVLRPTGCTIAVQPGRSIVGEAGVLLVRVLYRKQGEGKMFIVVDGGMNDLIRPSLYGAHHQIVPVVLRGRAIEIVDVVGPVCESGDFFAQDRPLPGVDRGETLAVLSAGAYGYVLSSNYNARLRASEVLLDGGGATLIRPREELEDLLP
jgi:diaminopimelate decarboxylase